MMMKRREWILVPKRETILFSCSIEVKEEYSNKKKMCLKGNLDHTQHAPEVVSISKGKLIAVAVNHETHSQALYHKSV
jgi:hypothetical protein